jgi:hypothetical protein
VTSFQPIQVGATARYITPLEISTFQTIEALPERLSAQQTMVIFIDPDGHVTHLNGPLAGQEGVRLGPTIQGDRFLPMHQIVTESAWQMGATVERQVYDKRQINFRITIGGTGFNNYTYRISEDRWWKGMPTDRPGWWGEFTRYSGWRFTAVWLDKGVETPQKMDPVAYGNNMATYDITFLAPLPYYSKPATFKVWKAGVSGEKDSDGFYSGHLPLANRGDMSTCVQYLVNGPGVCQVQDNNSATVIELPELFATDGTVLVNTDPAQRTLISSNDPVDNEYYKLLRASQVLNFFLGDLASLGQQVWQRKYLRFTNITPSQTVVHYKVRHTNPDATITAIVPQRFSRSW